MILARFSPPNTVRVLGEFGVGVEEFGDLEVWILLKTCVVV
jgi:hypothetical protein